MSITLRGKKGQPGRPASLADFSDAFTECPKPGGAAAKLARSLRSKRDEGDAPGELCDVCGAHVPELANEMCLDCYRAVEAVRREVRIEQAREAQQRANEARKLEATRS